MASSTNLPFLVCTNTWRDYAVTVRRGNIEPLLERLVLNRLLPAFGSVVASGNPPFGTAVGVASVPSSPDRLLAFRVFDCGVYQGRAHTIGLVAVVVPRQGRSWPLSALLAQLPAPMPNSEQYDLPAQLADTHPQPAEPFASLDAWDRSEAPPPSGRVVCFCTPAALRLPEIDWTVEELKPESKMPHSGRFAVILVVLAVAVASGFGAWRWRHPPSTPGSGRDTTQAGATLDDGRMRDRLITVLGRLGFLTEAQARTKRLPELKYWAVKAAEDARQRMMDLRSDLINLPANVSLTSRTGAIKEWVQGCQRPRLTVQVSGVRSTDQETTKALEFLTDVYDKRILDNAKDFIENDNNKSGYKRFLEDLKEALGGQS